MEDLIGRLRYHRARRGRRLFRSRILGVLAVYRAVAGERIGARPSGEREDGERGWWASRPGLFLTRGGIWLLARYE